LVHLQSLLKITLNVYVIIYKETGWDKLKVRREVKNLTLFYKIYYNLAPEYLSDLIPPTVSETSNYY
jgi:hypothetical protein